MAAATQIAAKRAARKAAGLCTECDTPAMKGHSVCKRHFEMRQRRLAEFNERRHEDGRCYCGARVKRGRDRCPTCLAIENERSRIRMAELKAAGKCVICGQRRALRGKVRCLRCSARAAEYYQNSKERRQLRLVRRGQLAARVFVLHEYSVGAQALR